MSGLARLSLNTETTHAWTLPEAVQVPPAEPTQVQVTPLREAGSVSATVAPVTATGPALLAVSV